MILAVVSLEGAYRSENGHPLVVVGATHDGDFFEQVLILDVHQAGGHFRAFQGPADAEKLPAFVVRHGGVGDAMESMRAKFDLIAKAMGTGGNFLLRIEAGNSMVEGVDVFPHFAGNAIANGAGVFAGLGDALNDGTWVVLAESQEIENIFRIGFGEGL